MDQPRPSFSKPNNMRRRTTTQHLSCPTYNEYSSNHHRPKGTTTKIASMFLVLLLSLLSNNSLSAGAFVGRSPSQYASRPTAVSDAPELPFYLPLRQQNHRIVTRRPPSATTTIRSRPTLSSSKSTTSLSLFTESEAFLIERSSAEAIDAILDESLRMSSRKPIMIQFEPSSKTIWKRWKGTVFAETWKSAVRQMLWAATVCLVFRRFPATAESLLANFANLYTQILSITTFTLTFFVNESYTVWRTCLSICRTLQGRLNDLGMALAAFAVRRDSRPLQNSNFTPDARRLLQVVARYIRLFNVLCYASLTRSHRPLLTPQGMRRMVARGLLTSAERETLLRATIPATQRHNAVLLWILRIVIDGRKAGHVDGGFGFEQSMVQKTQEIRAQGNSMESVLRGRMPAAYAHLVHVLVTTVLWSYPVVAFSNRASPLVGIAGSALLTICYQGLFDLAKQFLDPFYNENFWRGDDPLNVDTLLAETNAGSVRWMYGLAEMPVPYTQVKSGALDEFVLPDEGFTREEADSLEAEQRERDREQAASLHLTPREQEERMAEAIESAEEELEEAKRILEAPPGSDFVPGLDDNEEDDEDGEWLDEDVQFLTMGVNGEGGTGDGYSLSS